MKEEPITIDSSYDLKLLKTRRIRETSSAKLTTHLLCSKLVPTNKMGTTHWESVEQVQSHHLEIKAQNQYELTKLLHLKCIQRGEVLIKSDSPMLILKEAPSLTEKVEIQLKILRRCYSGMVICVATNDRLKITEGPHLWDLRILSHLHVKSQSNLSQRGMVVSNLRVLNSLLKNMTLKLTDQEKPATRSWVTGFCKEWMLDMVLEELDEMKWLWFEKLNPWR